MDPVLRTQFAPYEPWIITAMVFVLFMALRLTRKALRKRVDEIGYWTLPENGPLVWFWLNAPGVIIHELSHAFVVLLFRPFGFRITSITLFRISAMPRRQKIEQGQRRSASRQSLQLGEVQYVRPQGKLITYIGDGLSGIAPLFGGIAMLILLYWVATGYNIWDLPWDSQLHFQFIRPGWPWWTLLFAPYLILTATSELWPSRQDWRGARWFLIFTLSLLVLLGGLLWYTKVLIFNNDLLLRISSLSLHIDFALAVLIILDLIFVIVAEIIVRIVRH